MRRKKECCVGSRSFRKRSAIRKSDSTTDVTVNVVQDHQVEHPTNFDLRCSLFVPRNEITTRAHKSRVGRTVGSKASRQ